MLILLVSFCLSLNLRAERPNVVLINIDDLGWTDLSCQGSMYYETPQIDRLASDGMVFTNGYAAAANCAPSRACLLTGQNTPRHGVYTVNNSDRGKAQDRRLIPIKNTKYLAKDAITIGTLFRKAGYATATMGKWHVTHDPLKNGFILNIGGNEKGGPYTGGYNSPFKYPNLHIKEKGHYLTDTLTDRAIQFITQQNQKPFFLYLPFYQVHSPLQAKPNTSEHFENKAKTKAHFDATLAAMIATLDHNVGRLIHTLDQLNLRENTIVIFTSDNGGVWKTSRQWPLRAGKGSYYEGGIRVPLFVKWPAKIKAGSTSATPVSHLDLFPTLIAAAGITAPSDYALDGDNLIPLLTGKEKLYPERPLFWHFPIYLQADGASDETRDAKFRTRPGSAMRMGKWKLHEYFEDGSIELYDLDKDLGERKNLAMTHSDIANKMHQQLKQWRRDINAPVPTKLNPKYDSK